MRLIYIFFGVLSFLLILGCSDLPVDPINGKNEAMETQNKKEVQVASQTQTESLVTEPPAFAQEFSGNMNETLSGAEIPSAGEVVFIYYQDASSIQYELTLKNIDKVEQVYIALYSRDANRNRFENVVLLYPEEEKSAAASGEQREFRIKGEITTKDLLGTLRGKGVESLIQSFEQGTAFLHLYSSFSRSVSARGAIL